MSRDQLLNNIQGIVKEKNLPHLLERHFVTVNNDGDTSDSCVVRVMQWNMLAQALSGDNFIRCPPEALNWEIRKLRVLEEILRFNPSIIGMQEVDHFAYIEESLKPLGYAGLFLPKPHSVCLRFEDNNGPDGCAVFYREEKYTLLHYENIFLKNDEGGSTNQVALLCKFQLRDPEEKSSRSGDIFYFVVTHLKAKIGFEEKRFQQGKYLLQQLTEKCESLPIIVCGDFNAEFNEKVYKEFQESPLNLTSAYTNLSDGKTEPPYTTWKVRQGADGEIDTSRTIDYLWHTKNSLRVQSLLSLPTAEQIGYGRLPSFTYPSDHLSLVCDIKILSNDKKLTLS